jgi:NarL family two-component system response regulator YdfI
MDLRMPELDGLSAIREIRGTHPEIAIIVLTTYDEDDFMIQGLQAGIRGYLLKDSGLEKVLQSIHAAARGEMLIQPEMMERVFSYQGGRSSTPQPEGEITLTERERAVLTGVARGERNKEIAVHLGITRRTVESYLTNIYTKLGVDSRAAAVAIALEKGLLPRNTMPDI